MILIGKKCWVLEFHDALQIPKEQIRLIVH